jgi:16S rRNA (cytosine967-C5)-methyltransferase
MTSPISAREHAARLIDSLLGNRREGGPRHGETARLDPRDERFAAEIAHGVVRHLSRVDWVVANAAGKEIGKIVAPALAAARIGVYQLLFTPSVPPYAAVSASVDLARTLAPQTAGFVNWLLRRVGPEAAALPRREDFGDETAWLATFHSFPHWLVRRWVKRLGQAQAAQLLEAMNVHPPPHLRVNRLRGEPVAAGAALAAAGFEVVPGRFAPDALRVRGAGALTETTLFREGVIYFQDESSQLAALVLMPRAGERILDACTGVGGKATQIAELSGNGAIVVAVDQDSGRLARLAENARRLGAAGIEQRRGDLLDPSTCAGERFDAVLLDAPCSALGTIPRHPEIKWAKRASDPKRLAELQLRLLERSADLLAPGGRIVYSTCSTEPEEGEGVVGRFLAAHPGFGVTRIVGAGPGGADILNAGELSTPEGFLRAWPHRHGIGGTFVALLARNLRSTALPKSHGGAPAFDSLPAGG